MLLRRLQGLLLTAVLLLSLPLAPRTVHAANSTTITFMMFSWSGQSGFEQVLNRFRKLHPTIHINEVWLSWQNYWPKLLTELIAGDPPDVFDIEQGNLVQFASKGLLLPLDAYMKRDSVNASDFYTASLLEGQWNGKSLGTSPGTQYALPWDYQVGVWFYNKTMFEHAGVPLPKPGWTWADVRADALKLTKRDASGNITQYGTIAPNNPNADLWLLTTALGGSYFSPGLNKVTLGGGFAKAVQFSHDLIWKDKVAPPYDPTSQIDPFLTGKVGMWSSGTWQLFPYQSIKSFQWDIAPIPSGAPGMPAVDWGAANRFAIARASKNPDATWELLRFLAGNAEGQQMIARMRIEPPDIKAFSPLYYNAFKQPQSISIIPASFNGAQAYPDFMGWDHQASELNKLMGQVLIDPGPVGPALQATQSSMQALLDQQWQQFGQPH